MLERRPRKPFTAAGPELRDPRPRGDRRRDPAEGAETRAGVASDAPIPRPAHGAGRLGPSIPPRVVALLIGVAVLLQRAWLWGLYGASINTTVRDNPDWLTLQFLPVDSYLRHLGADLLYLQQTPPLPHLVLGALAKVLSWPVGVADALFALQACISAGTSASLFVLLLRIGGPLWASVGLACWFGFSTDLYLLEINAFGQLFYETGAMLLCTGTALCLCRGQTVDGGNVLPSRACVGAGLLTGLAVLTRASFAYFAVPVTVAAALRGGLHRGALRGGMRRGALVLLPVLVLQGGWSIKNAIVHGDLTAAASSWSGLNAANGLAYSEGIATSGVYDPKPLVTFILEHADRFPDWFVDMTRRRGYVDWGQEAAAADVPADIRERDAAAQRALGGTDPFSNTDALRTISNQYARAAMLYALDHPASVVRKVATGYRFFWQPIGYYSGYFMGPLSVDAKQRSIFGSPLAVRHPPVTEWAKEGTAPVRVHPPTLSLIPLDTLAIYVLTFGLPLVVAADLAARWRRAPPWIGADLWTLIALAAYGVAVSTSVDIGENMRFRLAFEPVLIAVTVGVLRAAALGVRGRVEAARVGRGAGRAP